MSANEPTGKQNDAPPTYDQATGSSGTSKPTQSTHLGVPAARAATRKSMEDEARPLPAGWIRQWDTKEQHQYFVDTKADPPRSIWVHPMDDEETWNALPSEEKERLQAEEEKLKRPITPSPEIKGDSKGEKSSGVPQQPREEFPANLPSRPRQASTSQPGQKKGLGERLKDKVTGTTHEERERERAQRAEEERQYYEMHARFRAALNKAQMTGEPQWFAKDRDGKDIYIEPPAAPGYGYGGSYGGYGPRGYGYSPYTSGPYATPNARYVRPNYAYGRPGYGGGLALPIAGGLLGGALLGGLLF